MQPLTWPMRRLYRITRLASTGLVEISILGGARNENHSLRRGEEGRQAMLVLKRHNEINK